MPSTNEERNARRRINDKARRERIAEERAERLVLLEENNELKMRVLELEKDNATMKALLEMRVLELEKDNATMKALLISYEKDLEGITARQIYEMKHPKKKVVAEKKVEEEKPYFRFIDRAQTKRLFNIPHTEHLDDKGFTERASMICSLLGWLGYECKDYNKDVSPMLRDKKVSLKGLGKLFDIYKNQKQVFENIMEMIDKYDYPYAEINHPSLNDDFTI